MPGLSASSGHLPKMLIRMSGDLCVDRAAPGPHTYGRERRGAESPKVNTVAVGDPNNCRSVGCRSEGKRGDKLPDTHDSNVRGKHDPLRCF